MRIKILVFTILFSYKWGAGNPNPNLYIYIKPKLLKLPQISTSAQYFKKKHKTKKKRNKRHFHDVCLPMLCLSLSQCSAISSLPSSSTSTSSIRPTANQQQSIVSKNPKIPQWKPTIPINQQTQTLFFLFTAWFQSQQLLCLP